jgi:fimbrial chaperone protein
MRLTKILPFVICSIVIGLPTQAGEFSVSPIRLELQASKSVGVLTVSNAAKEPLVVQASALLWTQANGEDIQVPTQDLIVAPPVFTLKPNGEQIVRVALRRKPDAAQELTYRVLLAEVPAPTAEKFNGLRIALRLSLPIFIKPRTTTAPKVTWNSSWLAGDQLFISATNAGSAHLQISSFDVSVPGVPQPIPVSPMRYVLPASTVTWKIPAPAGAQRGAPLTITGKSDLGDFAATAVGTERPPITSP